MNYDIIGSLDADITFDSKYFRFPPRASLRKIHNWGLEGPLSGKRGSNTITGLPVWITFPGPVNCSGKNALKKSAAILR